MKRILIPSFLIIYLFALNGLAQEFPVEDSIPVVELMVKDTIDLEFQGPSSDVAFYMNGMVYLSNSKYHQKMIPEHITFGVIKAYFVPLDYIALENSIPLFLNDNFPYPPAGMSFTRDYQKVYFTQVEDHQGRRSMEKIYEVDIMEGKASKHEQLSFTTDPSRYLHPAISVDKSFMIFASDRTPSSGGLDLYITRKTSNGWSKPENMGHSINSSSHEWYPYLDHNNNLYFSSAGHMGYGGYDVYVCSYNGTSWDSPRNLTNYINTTQDELGFSIHPNKHMAVLTQLSDGELTGEVFRISLSEKALLIADNSYENDISVLLSDLIESGYTEGDLPSSSEMLAEKDRQTISTPLIVEEEEVEAGAVVEEVTKPEPAHVDVTSLMEEVEQEAEPEPDPNSLLFRVQILSSTKANTKPKVTVEGKTYTTFEYYYKGAYRITVGEFEELSDANAFRLKCKSSGFDQAWVAAFRGKERETDPSVFRKK